MSYCGVSTWPPIWTQGIEKNRKIIKNEIGILRHVHDIDPESNKIYLVVEYGKEHYVGTLIFDDVKFCHQMTDLLRQHINRLVQEIGDLDLSYTL